MPCRVVWLYCVACSPASRCCECILAPRAHTHTLALCVLPRQLLRSHHSYPPANAHTQTVKVLQAAVRERLPIVLVVNKIDRLILELKLPPADSYYKLMHTIEEVNNIIAAATIGTLILLLFVGAFSRTGNTHAHLLTPLFSRLLWVATVALVTVPTPSMYLPLYSLPLVCVCMCRRGAAAAVPRAGQRVFRVQQQRLVLHAGVVRQGSHTHTLCCSCFRCDPECLRAFLLFACVHASLPSAPSCVSLGQCVGVLSSLCGVPLCLCVRVCVSPDVLHLVWSGRLPWCGLQAPGPPPVGGRVDGPTQPQVRGDAAPRD